MQQDHNQEGRNEGRGSNGPYRYYGGRGGSNYRDNRGRGRGMRGGHPPQYTEPREGGGYQRYTDHPEGDHSLHNKRGRGRGQSRYHDPNDGRAAIPERTAGRYTERVDSIHEVQDGRIPPGRGDTNFAQIPVRQPLKFSSAKRGRGRGGAENRGFGNHTVPKEGFYRQMHNSGQNVGRQNFIPSGRDMLERQRPLLNPQPEETNSFTELTNNIAKQSIRDLNATIDTDKCMEIIRENDVTFITTETGTGKSTVIPHAIAQKYPNAMILITEPRRMSAIQLAQRVASLLDVEMGETVGFSVRGEHCGVLGTTRIMYITSYSLLLYLIRESPAELPFDFIILDEFHERPIDIQVSTMLIRELMRCKKMKPTFKLLLSSATVEDDTWKSYFSDFKVGEYSQCKEMFRITDKFAEEVCKLCGSQFSTIVDKEDVSQEQLSIIICRIYQTLERIAELVDDPGQSILVFLPGRAQVEQVCKWIEERYSTKYYPVMWHGEIELSVIEDALKKDCVQKTKVYLATDIAEVSLTLPDVVFVIDSCMNKRKKIDFTDSSSVVFPPLKLFWETGTNARQRRGRVGRVRNGIYMSMLSQEEHSKLSSHSGREYNSGDLDSVILHTLFVCGNPEEILKQCCEPPDERLVHYSLSLLQREGFIVSSKDRNAFTGIGTANGKKCFGSYYEAWEKILHIFSDTGVSYGVTLKGFITAHVPALLDYNTMVYFGCLLSQPDTSALLAATAAALFPFTTPFDHDRVARKDLVAGISEEMMVRMREITKSPSQLQNDLLVSVHAVLEFMVEHKDLSEEEITAWCESRSLIRSRVVDAMGIYEQMVERLGEFLPITGEISDEDLSRSASLLHIISIASNASRAVFVSQDEVGARRLRYNGEGLIIPFKCGKNEGTPTLCHWKKGDICISMTMFPGQDKYLGSLTAECTETQLYIVMILLTSHVNYTEATDSSGRETLVFRIRKNVDHTQEQVIDLVCETTLGQRFLVVRMMLCLKLAVMHSALRSGVSETEASRDLKDKTNQFPAEWLEQPLEVMTKIPFLVERLVMDTPLGSVKRHPVTTYPAWEVSQLVHFSAGNTN